MPSSLPAPSFCLVLGLALGCQGQDVHTKRVCDSLEECTGIDLGICSERLDKSIADYRLSRSGLVRCSRCLDLKERNATGCSCAESCSCQEILVDRLCDKACEEVQVVINARSSKASRANATKAFHASCGNVKGTAMQTAQELETELKEDSTLAIDVRIEACLECILPAHARVCEAPSNPSTAHGCPVAPPGRDQESPDGTDVGGGGATGEGAESTVDLLACSELVARCAAPCGEIQAMRDRFSLAAAAMSSCVHSVSRSSPLEEGDDQEELEVSHAPAEPTDEEKKVCYECFLYRETHSADTLLR